MSASTDRNLLFGLIALKMDFVSREQLLDAMSAWLDRKADPLALVLQDRGALAAHRVALLDALVAEHLADHNGDARRSLVAMRVETPLHEALSRLADAEVQHSIASLAPATVGEVSSSRPATSTAGGPSRYRKLRPHAKGGLGEVHIALDEELGREVALKEIQERHADRDEFRARFVREAEITGHLEHPGIVPVHGLGTNLDGRPYYAMRFVRGESMHDAIARFHRADEARRDTGERELALRSLLARFVAVCNAVGYAHSRGIIHRDLKPANVMLGEYGETLVVDWGLAKALDVPEGATAIARPVTTSPGDSTPTEVGQAVGTPAFMPPEQARGELDRIDARSDVFALGATLYCLLTGRPPYQGSPTTLLSRAAEGRVAAAREVNRRVPAALEAVCARAMAPRREDRYDGARQLAADVERWLADEPVGAYRDPASVKWRRWAKRNRTLVGGGVALLAAGVVGLSLGLWAVSAERRRTEEALGREEDQRKQAEGHLAVARANLERATKAEADANANLKQADENFALARKVVEDCYGVANSHPLLVRENLSPDLRALRHLLMEKALPFYARFRGIRPKDKAVRLAEWEQHFSVAGIQRTLGKHDEALASYRTGLALLRPLHEARPDDQLLWGEMAGTLNNMATVLDKLGRLDDAGRCYEEAQRFDRRLTAANPDKPVYKSRLAKGLYNHAVTLTTLGRGKGAADRFNEAVELYREVVRRTGSDDDRLELARSLNGRGMLWKETGLWKEARDDYVDAITLYRKVIGARTDLPHFQSEMASTLHNLGNLQSRLGDPRAALKTYTEAAALRRVVAEAQPDVPYYRLTRARTLNAMGVVQDELGQSPAAQEGLETALGLCRGLLAQAPRLAEYRAEYVTTLNHLGSVLRNQGKAAKALPLYREARQVALGLAADQPEAYQYAATVARVLNNLAMVQQDLGRAGDAVTTYAESVEVRRRLIRAAPGAPEYPMDHAQTLANLGGAYVLAGRLEEALRVYTEAATLNRALLRAGPTPPRVPVALVLALKGVATLLNQRGRPDRALAALDEAEGLARRLAVRPGAEPSDERWLAGVLVVRAQVLSSRGRFPDARKSSTAAVAVWRRLAKAGEVSHSVHLAQALIQRGRTEMAMRLTEEARDSLREGVELMAKALAGVSPGAEHAELAAALNTLGDVQLALKQPAEAQKSFTAAIGWGRKLVAAYPGVPDNWLDLIRPLRNRAVVHFQAKRPKEARADLDEAVKALGEMRRRHPRHPALAYHSVYLHLDRSILLSEQGKHKEALSDLNEVVRFSPPQSQYWARTQRALGLARAGEHRLAVVEASALARAPTIPPGHLYDLARILSMSAAGSARDARMPLPLRERFTEARARGAVTMLARAAAGGLFRQPAAVAYIDKDKDLDFVRGRGDYKRFRAGLGGSD